MGTGLNNGYNNWLDIGLSTGYHTYLEHAEHCRTWRLGPLMDTDLAADLDARWDAKCGTGPDSAACHWQGR